MGTIKIFKLALIGLFLFVMLLYLFYLAINNKRCGGDIISKPSKSCEYFFYKKRSDSFIGMNIYDFIKIHDFPTPQEQENIIVYRDQFQRKEKCTSKNIQGGWLSFDGSFNVTVCSKDGQSITSFNVFAN